MTSHRESRRSDPEPPAVRAGRLAVRGAAASPPAALAGLMAVLLAVLGCTAARRPPASAGSAATEPPRPAVELLATAELVTGQRFAGTEVGGLSALAFDRSTGDYLALSDDRGERPEDRGPVRLYRLRPRPDARGLPLAGGVELIEVTALTRDGAPPPPGEFDPEGLAVADDALWVSSEGVAAFGVPPFVRRFGRDGAELSELPLPPAFVPGGDGSAGVRDNLGFEALTLTPDGRRLIAGVESSLVQDGPAADFETPSRARLVIWDPAAGGEPLGQYLYPLEPVPWKPAQDAFRVNGLVELVALDDHRLLALERAFAMGCGTALRLYRVDLDAATDVSGVHSLADEASGEPAPRPAGKVLVADLGELLAAAGIAPDNVEAMTFGPDLPDGRRLLLMVSDNNFSPLQRTLFLAFAVAPRALE